MADSGAGAVYLHLQQWGGGGGAAAAESLFTQAYRLCGGLDLRTAVERFFREASAAVEAEEEGQGEGARLRWETVLLRDAQGRAVMRGLSDAGECSLQSVCALHGEDVFVMSVAGEGVPEEVRRQAREENDRRRLPVRAATSSASAPVGRTSTAKPKAATAKPKAAAAKQTKAKKQVMKKKTASTSPAADRVQQELDTKVAHAEALFRSGRHQEAASLVSTVVLSPEGSNHTGGLRVYARFAAMYQKTAEAISAILRAITGAPNDKPTRELFAEIMTVCPQATEMLVQQLRPEHAASAAGLGFLGTILKDEGAVDQAAYLLSLAQSTDPERPTYALNAAHAWEICLDYDRALQCARDFFEHGASARLGQKGLTHREIVELAFVLPADEDEEDGSIGEAGDSGGDGGAAPAAEDKETYSEDDLDVLALAMTVVKILYLQGALGRVRRLTRLIERSRLRSVVELHTTNIRNENAYFSCILQTLQEMPRSSPPTGANAEEAAPKRFLLLGDSHCISPAWCQVQLPRQAGADAEAAETSPCTLVPMLVTGLKHYHLRDGERFYPRQHFERTAAALPREASVVFMLGEIDCREGILRAVEKGAYNSEAEAIETTIRFFIDAALRLVREKQIEAYVHPVIPVLDVTRRMVKAYNVTLERLVRDTDGELKWLNMFDDLLTDDNASLCPEYELDGTHLHPRYVNLLERALREAGATAA